MFALLLVFSYIQNFRWFNVLKLLVSKCMNLLFVTAYGLFVHYTFMPTLHVHNKKYYIYTLRSVCNFIEALLIAVFYIDFSIDYTGIFLNFWCQIHTRLCTQERDGEYLFVEAMHCIMRLLLFFAFCNEFMGACHACFYFGIILIVTVNNVYKNL